MNDILSLSKKLDYKFTDLGFLEAALTHRSAGKNNNERLEYLGDAVLGFIIAEEVYKKFPLQPEGVLTRVRANLVKKETLAELARSLTLGDFLNLGEGEKRSGGWRRSSILANALEAIIGAIYLDSELTQCKKFVLTLYDQKINEISLEKLEKDPKTELQEYLQARKLQIPTYEVIDEQGEPHLREYTVECTIDGLTDKLVAKGRSKRAAEQSVANKALEALKARELSS